MNREKIIELARKAGLAYGSDEKPLSSVERFAALIEAEVRGDAEPVGYWQGQFSQDGGATLYEVPQVSAFGRSYPNIPLWEHPPAEPKGAPDLFAEFYEDGSFTGDASEFADCLEEPVALYRHPPAPAAEQDSVDGSAYIKLLTARLNDTQDEIQRLLCALENASKERGL